MEAVDLLVDAALEAVQSRPLTSTERDSIAEALRRRIRNVCGNWPRSRWSMPPDR